MDDELRIRLIGIGLQLTLLGGFATLWLNEVGLSLVVVGTVVTGWGVS